MKVLLGTLLFTLIAGTSCQLAPTEEQLQCLSSYAANNPTDPAVQTVITDCGDALTGSDPSALCMNEACFNALDTIYRRCGFTGLQLGGF